MILIHYMQKRPFGSRYASYSNTRMVLMVTAESSPFSISTTLNVVFFFNSIFNLAISTNILVDKSCPIGKVLF